LIVPVNLMIHGGSIQLHNERVPKRAIADDDGWDAISVELYSLLSNRCSSIFLVDK
jgi:hypothetical protein